MKTMNSLPEFTKVIATPAGWSHTTECVLRGENVPADCTSDGVTLYFARAKREDGTWCEVLGVYASAIAEVA